MKAVLKRIVPPKMPTEKQIESFCMGLSDNGNERALLACCIALSLATAPDDERSFYTAYGYACHFADGFTQSTLEAVRMWINGELGESTASDIPDRILRNFRGAYLFRWQRRLIEYALACYGEIMDNAGEICSSCCAILSSCAMHSAPLLKMLGI